MRSDLQIRRTSFGMILSALYFTILGIAGLTKIFMIPPADIFGRGPQIAAFFAVGVGFLAAYTVYLIEKERWWAPYLGILSCLARIVQTLIYLKDYLIGSFPLFELYLPIIVLIYMVFVIIKPNIWKKFQKV